MVWEIEMEPEVDEWVVSLEGSDFVQTAAILDRLSERGNEMRMPQSRSLGSGLFELRYFCAGLARRITYWFGPDRRVVLLTTFHKQRNNERREVERARAAMVRCMSEHMKEES
jgi:hypothetical protein